MSTTFDRDFYPSLYGTDWDSSIWSSKEHIEFRSQDAKYRVKEPQVTATEDGGLYLEVAQDHEKHAWDDHSTLKLWFDADAVLQKVDLTYSEGGNDKIPGLVMKGLKVASVFFPEVGAAMAFAAKAWNAVSGVLEEVTDDGGRLNFPAVIAHDINKLAASVRRDGQVKPTTGVSFDADLFLQGVKEDQDEVQGWVDKNSSQVVEYKSDGHKYRTWRPDLSSCLSRQGLFVSMKIDHIRMDPYVDDHASLMLHFNEAGTLVQGVASVQLRGAFASGVLYSDVITGDSIGSDLADQMKEKIAGKVEGTGQEKGRENIGHVLKRNTNWVVAAVQSATL